MEKINSILLVDDDVVAQFINKALIKRLNVCQNIQFAMNGEEAIQLLATCAEKGTCPNLIFLDLNMPVMDGFEFLNGYDKLFADEKKIKIIILTSSSNPNDVMKIQKYSFIAHYLTKPLTKEKLYSVIETIQ